MILGIETDECGRCVHYHSENDIVALQCAQCKQYYACFKCHNQMCTHLFTPITTENTKPIMCGHCKNTLTYEQYQQYMCPFCQASFNPRCALHKGIYFK